MRPARQISLEQAIDCTSRALVPVHLSDRMSSNSTYLCPDCSAVVIPVRGAIYRWHYRHHQTRECSHSVSETPLHKTAKAIVAQATEITLPAGGDLAQAQRVAITHCELEKQAGGVRYDALLQTEIGPVAVEICVTHRVDEYKADKLAAIKIPCVEITLSPDGALEAVAETVLHEAPREWIHEPAPAVERAGRVLRTHKQTNAVRQVSIHCLVAAWQNVKRSCTAHLDRAVVSRGGTGMAVRSMANFDIGCLESLCEFEIEDLNGLIESGVSVLIGGNAANALDKLERAQARKPVGKPRPVELAC